MSKRKQKERTKERDAAIAEAIRVASERDNAPLYQFPIHEIPEVTEANDLPRHRTYSRFTAMTMLRKGKNK